MTDPQPLPDDEYEVKRVAGRCYIKNEVHYLIEWKGFHPSENTWECKENLLGNDALISQFLRTYRNENPGKSIARYETLLLKDAYDVERPSADDHVESTNESGKNTMKSSKTNKIKHSPSTKKRTKTTATATATTTTTTTTTGMFVFDQPLSPLSSVESWGNESSEASTSSEVLIPTDFMDMTRPKKKVKTMLPVVIAENEQPVLYDRECSLSVIAAAQEELDLIQNSMDRSKLESLRLQHSLVVSSDGSMTFDNVYPPVSVVNDLDKTPFPEIFVYINNLIYNSAVPKPDPAFLSGCDCLGKCKSVRGEAFCHEDNPYTNNGRLSITHSGAIYECNSACNCDPDACPNRVVQRGRTVPLEIFKTRRKGWGVRAKTNIKKNTFVEEYLGEVITEEEGSVRGKVYDKIGISYLFDMDLADGDDQKYVIDSYICGNSSHFFNHSCCPNLIVYGVFYDSMDPSFHRLAFFANKDIAAGDELTFDYTGTNDADDTFSKKFPCHCGTHNCRNWIHI